MDNIIRQVRNPSFKRPPTPHNITIHYGAGVRTVTRGGRVINLNDLDKHEERALRAAVCSRYPQRRNKKGESK